jgi:hypothetical protein
MDNYQDFFNVKKIIKDIEEYIVKVAADFEKGDKLLHPDLLKLLEGKQPVEESKEEIKEETKSQ